MNVRRIKRRIGRLVMWVYGAREEDVKREVSEQAGRITDRARSRGESPERVRSIELSLTMMSREMRRREQSGQTRRGRQ